MLLPDQGTAGMPHFWVHKDGCTEQLCLEQATMKLWIEKYCMLGEGPKPPIPIPGHIEREADFFHPH